jgi:MFS family permease
VSASLQESAERDYQELVRERLPRNFTAYLAHGLLGRAGMQLINAPTFIPLYVHAISGSDVIVGIARALQYLGMFATPFLAASLIESRRRVLPVGFAIGAGMRAMVLGIGLGGLLLPDPWRLISVCAFLGGFGALLGMQGVVFNFLMSKLFPVELRGRLVGLRNFLGGLTATAVAGIGGYLVGINALGDGYAATFLVAFVLTSIGLCMLLLVREPEPPRVREREALRRRLTQLPELLRSDPAFTRYFLARATATMGRMALPFYALFVKGAVGLSGAMIGTLSASLLLASTVANLLWGWLGDRGGFRRVFLIALSLWVASTLAIHSCSELWHFALVFAGIGAGQAGFQMSSQNMVLEFGERDDLPMRIAVANSSSEFVGALGLVVGGLLAASVSYAAVFGVAIGFQLAAIGIVLLFVDEPRHRSTVR